jgi:dipeptidyl aminopeptidase/acylaminoacyl peptidase
VINAYRYAEPKASLVALTWSRDGKYLAYILTDEAETSQALWFQPLDNGSPRKIADLHDNGVFELSGLALSPDGKSFAVIQGAWNHDAVLIKGLK